MDSRKTNTIGVVGYGTEITDHPNFFDDLIRGILHGAGVFDVDVSIIRPSQWSGPDSLPVFSGSRYDGLILLATALLPRIFEGVDLSGLPAVTIGGGAERSDLASVDVDNYGSARAAVQHLLQLGHRRIAYISSIELAGWAVDRYRAYVDALESAGVELDESRVIHLDIPSVNNGYDAACLLLTGDPSKRPTAFATVNDDVAKGVLSRLHELSLNVPEDVSVIGFDDNQAALTDPPLSTIRQPKHAIGAKAVELLAAQIRNPNASAQHIVIPGELVTRASTGAASH